MAKAELNPKKELEKQPTEEVIVKRKKLADSYLALTSLVSKNPPVMLRFKLIRIMKAMQVEFDSYSETRESMAKEASGGKMKMVKRPDAKGVEQDAMAYDLSDEASVEIEKKMAEIGDQEVLLNITRPTLEDFNDFDGDIGGELAFLSTWLIV